MIYEVATFYNVKKKKLQAQNKQKQEILRICPYEESNVYKIKFQ